ncbi:MAG TPA: amino acid deaminase [Clostridia bacterium]|nr:amino acid deaminase [Clostridia bacterium]
MKYGRLVTVQARSLNLDQLLDEPIDWRYKSFPAGPPTPIRAVRARGWNVLGGEFMLPVMVLKESALRHNSKLMASYCRRHDVLLAPHGKTPMSPQLLKMQLDDGAWAVTAATMSQVRIWRAFGVERVILANELVEPASVRWVAGEMLADPGFDFYCLVDSVAGVRLLESALGGTGLEKRLRVLLEVGPQGGRAGCRTGKQAQEVARAVAASGHLALAGVEAFEGVIHGETLAGTLEAVDRFLDGMRAIAGELDAAGLFAQVAEVIVTAGGSAFPDRAVACLGGSWQLSRPVRLVLRSGCYLTHDAVHYSHLSPFGGRIPETGPLEEALEVWGAVLSLPEPGLALVGFGKRDVSYDHELPVPRLVKTAGPQPPRPMRGEASIVALNDQHAFMKVDAKATLKVGDLVGCGISHPCTAFDKWRLIPVVDDAYRVLDAILTYF